MPITVTDTMAPIEWPLTTHDGMIPTLAGVSRPHSPQPDMAVNCDATPIGDVMRKKSRNFTRSLAGFHCSVLP
jgi:hypothetical protein